MKRNRMYEIDYTTNTIVITKAFHEAASQLGTDAFKTMTQLRKLNMPFVILRKAARRHHANEEGEKKFPRVSYKKMGLYIDLLDDADEMKLEFEQIKKTAKSQKNAYEYTLNWFKTQFPTFADVPEMDEAYNIVHNPNVA